MFALQNVKEVMCINRVNNFVRICQQCIAYTIDLIC